MTDWEFPTIRLILPMSLDRDVQPGQTCVVRARTTYKTQVDMVIAVPKFEIRDVATSGRSWDLAYRDKHGCITLLQPCVCCNLTSAQDIVVTLAYLGTQPKDAGNAACAAIGVVAFPDEYAERVLLGSRRWPTCR